MAILDDVSHADRVEQDLARMHALVSEAVRPAVTTSLAPVEEAPRISGKPEWIERSLNVKAGRDPLGLQTITLDRIMPILLPGILVLSRRARYLRCSRSS